MRAQGIPLFNSHCLSCNRALEPQRSGPGQDFDCRCGAIYNSAGQQVRYRCDFNSKIPPPEFDPLDAGERWDDDD